MKKVSTTRVWCPWKCNLFVIHM